MFKIFGLFGADGMRAADGMYWNRNFRILGNGAKVGCGLALVSRMGYRADILERENNKKLFVLQITH